MSIGGKVVSSSFWVLIGSIFSSLANFVVFAALARILGPIDFGLVALASVFIDLCKIFLSASVADAVVQREEWNDAFASTAFWCNLGLAIAIFCVMVVGTLLIPTSQTDQRVGEIAIVLAVGIVIEASSLVPLAKLKRAFQYRQLTIRTMIVNVVSGCIGVLLAWYGFGVWALVAQRLLAAFGTAVGTWLMAKWRPKIIFIPEFAREIVKFSSGLIAGQALAVLNGQVPALLIGLLLGPAPLAQFRVGARALNVFTQITIIPLQDTAVAGLSRLSDTAAVRRGYLRLTAACSLVACPVFFGCAAIAPDIVSIAFGTAWKQAGEIMRWGALIVGPSSLLYFLPPAMTATRQTHLSFVYYVGAVVGSTVAALFAIPFGVIATAASQTIRAHITLPFALQLLRRGIGAEPIEVLRNVAVPYTGALIMFLGTLPIAWLWPDLKPVARLCITIPVAAFLYLGFMITIGRKFTAAHYEDLTARLPERFRTKVPVWRN